MKKCSVLHRLLAIALMLWQGQELMAQADGFDWYVSYTDSAEVSLDLANLRSLKFSYSERTMTANYRDGSSRTHDYSRISKMYFAAASGIDAVTSDKQLYALNGTMLTLNEKVNSAVLYRLDGTPVMTITDSVVQLHGLQPGIYVLRVDNQTAKLCVR